MAKPNHGNQKPVQNFRLRFCTVSLFRGWAWTQFDDGEGWGAVPSDDPSYRRLARKLGYGTDTMAYCLEHDFLHSFLEERLFRRPSPILWSLAHDLPHPETTVYEEAIVQAFQGFLRASDEDGQYDMTATAPDVDWCEIREEVYEMLGRWRRDVRQ